MIRGMILQVVRSCVIDISWIYDDIVMYMSEDSDCFVLICMIVVIVWCMYVAIIVTMVRIVIIVVIMIMILAYTGDNHSIYIYIDRYVYFRG